MRSVEVTLRQYADSTQPLIEVLDTGGAPSVTWSSRDITRAARHLADRLAAVRTRRADGRLRVGVLCGDGAEFMVAALALLSVRAVAHLVPLDALPGQTPAGLGRADVVVADAVGHARLAAWDTARALPAGLRVEEVDIAEGARKGRAYTLPATGTGPTAAADPAPGRGADDWEACAASVTAVLEMLRDGVPETALDRCTLAAPMTLSSRQVALLLLILLRRGVLVLPPPGTVPPAGRPTAPGTGLPRWLRSARPTTLATTPALAADLAAVLRTAPDRGGAPVSAAFGTLHPPLLWCGEPLDDDLVGELDALGIPVCDTDTPTPLRVPPRNAGPAGRPPAAPGPAGPHRGPDDPAVRAALASLPSGGPGKTASPEVGWLLYSLVRSLRPATVLEAGGSYGSALLHLAAGLRDNGHGRAVGCAPNRYWAGRVRRGLTLAGLTAWAEVGDRCTCGVPDDTTRGLDVVVLSGWQEDLLHSLRALEPRMRPGTVVVAGAAPPTDYLAHVRESGGYTSLSLSLGTGVEVSHRLATPAGHSAHPAEPVVPISLPLSGDQP